MKLESRKTEARDLPAVKRMIDETLALDYYSMEELEDLLHGDQHLFYVVTDEDRGGTVVAYFYAFLSTLDEALPLLHVSEKPEGLSQYSGDTLVGVYKTASTEKEYHKLGICSSFVRELEPVLRERGAKLILATAHRPQGREIPMRHIFHDNGFTAIADIRHPWIEMTMYCLTCKRNHCICDAVFYVKKLEQGEEGNCRD